MADLHDQLLSQGESAAMVVGYGEASPDKQVLGNQSSRPILDGVVGPGLADISRKITSALGWRRNPEFRQGDNRFQEKLKRPSQWWAEERGYEYFDYEGIWRLLREGIDADLLHFHDLNGGYFDLRALPQLSGGWPSVITLHDEWILHGLCRYSLECDRVDQGCGQCPYLSMYPYVRRDATDRNYALKADLYRRCKLTVVTPCQWLVEKVEASPLMQAARHRQVIHNGIDLEVFRPGSKKAARAKLGLPQDKNIVLFVGNRTRSAKWKGFPVMEQAVRKLAQLMDREKLLFVLVGEKFQEQVPGMRFVPLIHDKQTLADYYRAADVFLHGALADTFPTTILESMACGLPVVATRVCGIPEQVSDGRTGILCPPKDPVALAEGMKKILSDKALSLQMGQAARQRAVESFDGKRMGLEYLQLYRKTLEAFGNGTQKKSA